MKYRAEFKIKPDQVNWANSELLAHIEGPVIDFGDLNPKLGWVGVLARSPEEDKLGPLFHFEFTPNAQSLWCEGAIEKSERLCTCASFLQQSNSIFAFFFQFLELKFFTTFVCTAVCICGCV